MSRIRTTLIKIYLRLFYQSYLDCITDAYEIQKDNNRSKFLKKLVYWRQILGESAVENLEGGVINKKDIENISNLPVEKRFKTVSTSGSTGSPFKAFWNKEKSNVNKLETLFYNSKIGISYGSRCYFFRIWNDLNRLSSLEKIIKNIRPIDVTRMTLKDAEKIYYEIKKDGSKKYILGYGSAFSLFFDLISGVKERSELDLEGIVITAEPISKEKHKQIEAWFNCKVMVRYSNAENGLIGQKFSSDQEYYSLNFNSFFVEVLSLENDTHADRDVLGRIVVSDLMNEATPFIRYDTGDVGKWSYQNGKKVLTNIEGRKLDLLFGENKQIISPHIVDYALRGLNHVKQFQLIQKNLNKFSIAIVTSNSNEFNTSIVKSKLKEILGKNAEIEVDLKDFIPFEKSGKHRMVKNLMTENHKVN